MRLQLTGEAGNLWITPLAFCAPERAKEAVFSSLRTGDQVSASALADEDLVRRCQAGSRAAFTEIVLRYQDRIHWFVRRMIGSLEGEDFTQEVFLRAYQALPSLRNGATLRTWLFRIAHNLCITELKKRARRGEHISLDEEGEAEICRQLPENEGRVVEEVERREFQASVREMVARLPVRYREVLTLYYVDEIKYEDIAEVMGMPLGTVKTHLHRARLRLRDLVLAEMDRSYLPGSECEP